MNLEEFVREKYKTGSKKTSRFESKYQMVLKRIHAVFDCFEVNMVKSGTRNTIVCEYGAPELDSLNTIDFNTNKICAIKLAAIFAFVMENYYMPNLNFIQKEEQDTDQLFKDFAEGLYLGEEKLEDLANCFQEKVLQNRVRFGNQFEQYLETIKDDNALKRASIVFCKGIYDCKQEVAELFQWLTDSKHPEDQRIEKINSVYHLIYCFCEKLYTEENDINLMRLFPFDWNAPYSIEKILPFYFDADRLSCDKKAQILYEQFRSVIQYYLDALNIPVYVIDDIDVKEKKLLDYLLDKFGKDSSEANSPALEKKILHLMETNQWEKIPLDQREKLLALINDLIEDVWEDEKDVYERLNKYIRAYTVDGVKDRLKRIELKMKYPEIYRVSRYLEKLHDLYGNFENAEDIMSFLDSEKLKVMERKMKNIFEDQEELYRYCEDPFEIEKRMSRG